MLFHNRSAAASLRRGAAPFALALGLLAGPAFAQDAQTTPPAEVTQPAVPAAEGQEDTIVVTGSLFRRTDTETPSPVTVLTSENLERAGITTISDAIRSISADSAGSIGTGFQTGFSAGGSAVSLRGLGVSSTLVLVDGLRSTNFPINDDGHNAYVDLNSIPFSLVDRVEVLKDGASSTYGADAIGGVVNIILKKQFNGIAGTIEGGVAERGDASRIRGNLTAGIGDYEANGWNVYINGEYQRDGRVSNHSRGFPYNTQDLTRIGGNDNNTADSGLTVNTPTAYVVRTTQTDLNNPLSGGTAVINDAGQSYATYTALGIANCARPTYYPLEKEFTSNLQDSVHFVQVGIAVSTPYDERVVENIKTHEIAIRSQVLMALGETTEEEVFTAEGKRQIQDRLSKAINAVLKEKEGFGGVSNVYFTNFIVQ